MDIVRCNWCEHIYEDSGRESAHCPSCGRNDCLMDLNGTEDFDDAQLEKLWAILGDIPMGPIGECVDEEFLCYPAGTSREDIWSWFDTRYSLGVYGLMYR